VDVEDGVVTLTGTVLTSAEDACWSVRAVAVVEKDLKTGS
jgi:osmotically-inducible protein OsmY